MKADCLSEAKGVMSRETGCALCLRADTHRQEVLQASPPEDLGSVLAPI